MTTVTYENVNTPGQRVSYPEPNPRLESLGNWQRVDDDAVTAGADTVIGRSEAEREAIEAAGRRRLREASARHGAAAEIAAASAKGQPQTAPPPQTASHSRPLGVRQPDGVLTRAKQDHQAGRMQIGDDPGSHPHTRAGLEAKVAADSKAIHEAGTGADNGVLARGRVALSDATGSVGTDEAERRAADPPTADTPEDAGTGGSSEEGAPPPRNASTDTWRTYLVDVCHVPADEVEGLDRGALIAKYDALPDA